MSNYVIASSKVWDPMIAENLSLRLGASFTLITRKEDLTPENLHRLSPAKIFFPHWSYILPPEIHQNFECVMFHMTDLPYGRGGSPLQNLIVRGHRETKISAFRCDGGLDTGPVYLKRPLALDGTALEIMNRASAGIADMIAAIVTGNPAPVPQTGEPTEFRRRKPEDGDLTAVATLAQAYDHIRMLDAEGYPSAFVEAGPWRFEFTNAELKENELVAKVRIKIKK